jgi:hypothetical protein
MVFNSSVSLLPRRGWFAAASCSADVWLAQQYSRGPLRALGG